MNRKTISLIPIIGSILMTMGYTRTTKCSMLQQMVSIMIWLGGCKRKVFGSLNRIGICQSAESTRRRLDDIKQDYDVKVKEWKDKLTRKEEEMGEADDTMSDLADLEDIWEDDDVPEEEGDEDNDERSSVVDVTEEQSKSDTTPDEDESTYSREAGSNIKTTDSSHSLSNQDATDVSIEDRVKLRDEVAREIVTEVFEAPNTKEVLNVSTDEKIDRTLLCLCHHDVGGTMIYCCNNNCERGSWFHLECLGMDEDEVPEGNWFCCEECQRLCATQGKKKKKTVDRFSDGKKEYVSHLIWRGLNDIARHAAIKENDEIRMIRHWKFDMFDFFDRNHPKYLIFGFRLLANISGATSDRLKHSFIWERTVNVNGGRRKNIPKDLHCEHLNREYKQSSRTAGGQLTEETVQ